VRALDLLAEPGVVDLRQAAAYGALNWYHAHRVYCSDRSPSIAGGKEPPDCAMAKKRPSRKPAGPSRNSVSFERSRSGQGWTLTHPACVREGAEDLDEVREMIASGEHDVAIDELRWLIETCTDWIEAHYLLGKLAVEAQGDASLGRAHFGFGYQLGERALRRAGNPTPVPAMHPANRPWYDAGRGLAWCLNELDKRDMALEVVDNLLRCDPSDPLGVRTWIDEIKTAGSPIVELGGLFTSMERKDNHDGTTNTT
jgi:hypothetical protein